MISGGQFNEELKKTEKKYRINMNLKIHCATFETAVSVLRSGEFAAILPDFHENELDKETIKRFNIPIYNKHKRKLSLVYKKDLFNRKSKSEQIISSLVSILPF